MINLTIDGLLAEVPADSTVLEAARKLRINIPTLCYYEAIEAYGGCRLCVVEVEKNGRSRLTASCTLPVEEGLNVQTQSPRVLKARQMTMELLLGRCPGVPALQHMARQLGVSEVRYSPGTSDCTLCGLCVRVCSELQHVGAIGLVGRGAKRQVMTPFGEFSEVCRTCGACAHVCPTGHMQEIGKISGKTPRPKVSEFNLGLTSRGNIYRTYPQAVPATPVIDPANCIQFLTGDCGVCAQSCVAGAIDYGQKEETVSVEVGSVILAPGFRTFDPKALPNLSYQHPNVVTTLEFERILSPGGPFQGHVQRLSDGREPKRIAWILCVGSRSEREGCQNYCSAVCCMTALKQAIIAKEHIGPELEMAIFYMDMRTTRKDFEKYYERVKGQGARMIRAMVHSVRPESNSGDLRLDYVTEAGEPRLETFDMVVLAVGMEIPASTRDLARRVGIDLSPHGFVEASCFAPVATSRPGIYACGAFTGPKDIPESVREGSAAVAAATQAIAAARNTLLKKKEYPPERDVWTEPPRVGVFVCNCAINIGGVADVPAIVEYARSIPDVAYAQENLFTCSEDAQNLMIDKIKEHRLNRVVVAACSPSTHQPIFQDMLRNAGLNKYLFEMANIRNHCTWVHQGEPAAATQKCRDLVNMSIAKARLLQPLPYLSVGVNKKALVIGGGVAGLSAALGLAELGYAVHLAERQSRLGGHALKLHTTWRGEPVAPFVQGLIGQVNSHPNIQVHLAATAQEVSGTVGNFITTLSDGQVVDHGAVILATGAESFKPEGMYLYNEHPGVLLSLQLDQELAALSSTVKDARSAAFIQCVGSRVPERPYCSRVCCSHSVENALKLKEINPDCEVVIFYRDLRTTGEREILYQQAREKGVLFIRYALDQPPVVSANGDGLKITALDHILNRPVSFTADLLTLATAIVPHDNTHLAELYKVALNEEGFFNEAHAKIRPVDCATEGIFLAGLCHNPKPLEDSIRLAWAAAARAATILSKEYLELGANIAVPMDENCDGCAFCVDGCPFKAITLMEYMREGQIKKTVDVNETLCKGCGSCMATCPKQGINVAGFSVQQLEAQVEAALGLI